MSKSSVRLFGIMTIPVVGTLGGWYIASGIDRHEKVGEELDVSTSDRSTNPVPVQEEFTQGAQATMEKEKSRSEEEIRREQENRRKVEMKNINRQYEAALKAGDRRRIAEWKPKWEAAHPTAKRFTGDFERGKEKGQACARSGTGSLGQIGAFPGHLVENFIDKMYDQMSGGFGFRGESQDFRLGWKCGFMEANGIGGEPYKRLLEKIADRTNEAIKQDE